VIVIDLQDEFPAASNALTTTVFVPTSSGISGVAQKFVPAALPDFPLETDHVTALTLALSVAVPRTEIEAEYITTAAEVG
jgi:hypothetical protein